MIADWFDAWTLGHMLLGIGLGVPFFFVRVRPLLWVLWLLTAWEWFENSDTVPLPWGDPSFFNGVVDLVVGVAAAAATMMFMAWAWPRVPVAVREAVT